MNLCKVESLTGMNKLDRRAANILYEYLDKIFVVLKSNGIRDFIHFHFIFFQHFNRAKNAVAVQIIIKGIIGLFFKFAVQIGTG